MAEEVIPLMIQEALAEREDRSLVEEVIQEAQEEQVGRPYLVEEAQELMVEGEVLGLILVEEDQAAQAVVDLQLVAMTEGQ